ILRSLGVTERADRVPFTFDIGGVEKTIELRTMGRKPDGSPEMGGISYAMGAAPQSGWIDARDRSSNPVPLYLQHQRDPYWFTYIEERKTLYIQCNIVGNRDGGETLEQFFARAYGVADKSHADRIVLDLRLNG